ncbi:hypothetical protein [Actinomadura flavalba]|uniref:hypothetical protein n=1 Tax=Actinomadura flavalba TaxID=1120938 RepID=UPI00035E3850|nr:hypothetical protein [Actinomadura flavalba]
MTAPAPPDRDAALSAVSARLGGHADTAARQNPRGSSAALLRTLANDLDPATPGSPAATDLATAYPAEALLPDPPPSRALARTAALLRVLRDATFLLPILVTWWKLREALEAYGRSDRDDVSFLLGWQAGSFDPERAARGVHDFPPLGDTALWVVGAVIAAIALTGLVALFEGRLDAPRYAAERDEIAQDLAYASYLLAQSVDDRVSQRDLRMLVQTMESSVGSLIERLAAAADEVREALEHSGGKRLEEAIRQWTAQAAALDRALAALQAPAGTLEAFRELHADLAASQRELRGELSGLVRQVERAGQAAGDQAATVRAYQEEGSTLLADSVARLATGADQLGRALDQLGYLVADSREFVDYVRRLDDGAIR